MENTLGDYLRSRRARIQPQDVGLPEYGRRRVPGLRREEVAQLAGVSVDYYIRLEQGRGSHVSDAVLDAVARVLGMDATEQAHLRDLARPGRKGAAAGGAGGTGRGGKGAARPAQRIRSGVRLLLDGMTDLPAFVLGDRMDVIAWNALGTAVNGFTPDGTSAPTAGSGSGSGIPNMARSTFLGTDSRTFYRDWPAVAAETVAHLRLYAGRHPDDERLAALVGELSVRSEDFRRLWADHQVKEKTYGVKRLRHPLVGEMDFGYETLVLPGEPDQLLVAYTTPPGSPTAERLALLASWSSEGAGGRTGDGSASAGGSTGAGKGGARPSEPLGRRDRRI